MATDISQLFPALNQKALLEQINNNAIIKTVSEGDSLLSIGDYIKTIPLLIKGSIKVMREDSDGNELFLYYVKEGETCAMALNCCMIDKTSTVKAIAEEDTVIYAIPVHFMDVWMKEYSGWKTFVMQSYRNKFDELLNTIDSIAFTKLDERLIKYLENKLTITQTNTINITHQKIAYELHSSREVISRLLKQLEKKGKVKLSRNVIEVIKI